MQREVGRAAALALVGWYLMVPPIIKTGGGGYEADFNSSLSQWQIVSAFDSAADCNAASQDTSLEAKRTTEKVPVYTREWAVSKSFAQVKCVATDDPRLAK